MRSIPVPGTWRSVASAKSPYTVKLPSMIIVLLSLMVSISGASLAGSVSASGLRALQELQAGKLAKMRTLKNSSITTSSAAAMNRASLQANPGLKAALGRYYPDVGSLSVREIIAKEAFRLVVQILLDRMPSKCVPLDNIR